MTKILTEFDFAAQKGRKPQYPWGTWIDGKIRQIDHDKDFTCTPASMSVQIYNKARDKGLTAHVSIVDKTDAHPGNVVFQFVRPATV